ncbi:MAG TPA: TonB-dependent receptor, partial [Gemmatimonadaceae bacterium]
SDDVATTITLSAENSLLDFRPEPDTTTAFFASQTSIRRVTSAALAQANLSVNDVGYVTAGLRVERNGALGNSTVSTLPMVGAAAVRDYGPLTLKVRSAYGRGIRPPTTAPRETSLYDPRHEARLTSLAPEEQSGIETGLDLFVGHSLGLQVTRFDQRAAGLIQRVAYVSTDQRSGSSGRGGPGPSPSPYPVPAEDRHIDYLLQNVGEITNRGWELRGDVNVSSLALGATFSTVDSRVQRLARGYIGDLRVGDRMLEVPARTASLTASWLGTAWTGSMSASRSWDWINYDRIALAGAFSNSTQTDAQLVGRELRNYWLHYSGVTRLRATLSRSVYRGLSLTVGGDNLLNRQNGEPDNVTVVPGRTLTFGLRANL